MNLLASYIGDQFAAYLAQVSASGIFSGPYNRRLWRRYQVSQFSVLQTVWSSSTEATTSSTPLMFSRISFLPETA
jgi:hypothetical protein